MKLYGSLFRYIKFTTGKIYVFKEKKVISDITCGYYDVKIDIYICTIYMRIVINEIFYIDDK